MVELNRAKPRIVPRGFATNVSTVTPTIPPRAKMLNRCVNSILKQTYPVDHISIALDHARFGAAATRNRALYATRTEWVAFIDDDDELYPNHVQVLWEHQQESGADVVWPWFDGNDPFPRHFGKQWDPQVPHSFPITAMVRRELALDVGGFPEDYRANERCAGEDWQFWLKVNETGAKFSHIPIRTWKYNNHGANTSGLAHRW